MKKKTITVVLNISKSRRTTGVAQYLAYERGFKFKCIQRRETGIRWDPDLEYQPVRQQIIGFWNCGFGQSRPFGGTIVLFFSVSSSSRRGTNRSSVPIR